MSLFKKVAGYALLGLAGGLFACGLDTYCEELTERELEKE
jgi:hypothetical protein